ncbi:MAG: hypothetical protein IMW98_00235 [Firmicutes bacterium]|nr:hypothetical protein [Bacillota bacterium]
MYPWIVLVVTVVFFVQVARQARASRSRHSLFWAVSLAMASLATAAYILAAGTGDAWAFRVYYALGAVAMAAYMGLGSLHLHWRRRSLRAPAAVTGCVVAASVVGAGLTFALPVDAARLAALEGGPGTGVISHEGWLGAVWLIDLILLNTFGVAAMVLVALASVFRAYTAGAPSGLAWGNGLIAAGGVLLGAAGTAARLGFPGAFWLVMSLGWIVVYGGFRLVDATLAKERSGAGAAAG